MDVAVDDDVGHGELGPEGIGELLADHGRHRTDPRGTAPNQ